MRRAFLCLFGLILVLPVYGQTGTGSSKPSHAPMTAPRHTLAMHSGAPAGKESRYKGEIPLNAPIVTLDGVCPQPAKGATKTTGTCKTVITRGQLDVLLDSIDPDPSPKTRQQFAISYARLLAASQLAEQKHLDLDPNVIREIQVQQKLARLQVLTTSLLQDLQKNAAHVPNKEVERYYKQFASNFEQADVYRLGIPLNAATTDGKPVNEAAAKAKMEELRARVLAGDDFEALQARAYKELGIKGATPRTEISMMRRGELTPEEAKVFEMDLGETSPVFENHGVLLLLRVAARRSLTVEEVRPQIEAILFQQRMLEELHEQTKGITADFNLKYMESTAQPDLFPPSILTPSGIRRGMLSSLHVQP